MASDHLAGLKHDDVDNGLSVALHIVRLDALFYLKRLDAIVSLDQKEACLLHYLDVVDSLVGQLLADEFVFSVYVNHIDVAALISCIELLVLIVPAKAREYDLVWIVELIVSFAFALRSLKPLECLIVTDREDQVL